MRKARGWGLAGLLIVGLLGLVLLARPSSTARPDLSPGAPVDRVPGGILVDLDDGLDEADVAALERRFGIDLRLNSKHSDDENLYRADAGARADELVQALSALDEVENAEIEGMYRMSSPPEQADDDGAPPDRWHFAP